MDTIRSLHIGEPVLADLVQQPVCNLDELGMAEKWRVRVPSERHSGWPLSGLASCRHERHGENVARPECDAQSPTANPAFSVSSIGKIAGSLRNIPSIQRKLPIRRCHHSITPIVTMQPRNQLSIAVPIMSAATFALHQNWRLA